MSGSSHQQNFAFSSHPRSLSMYLAVQMITEHLLRAELLSGTWEYSGDQNNASWSKLTGLAGGVAQAVVGGSGEQDPWGHREGAPRSLGCSEEGPLSRDQEGELSWVSDPARRGR